MAWRVISEERGLEEHHNKREEVDLFFAEWSDAKTRLVIFRVITCNSHKVDLQIYYDECKLALQLERFLNLLDFFHIFLLKRGGLSEKTNKPPYKQVATASGLIEQPGL